MSKADRDNHSNQLNPNNDAYWQSRGYDQRPDDWQHQAEATRNEQIVNAGKDSTEQRR